MERVESKAVFQMLVWFAVTAHWQFGAKNKLHTELHISGSGSANVGDRGIWGLKPLYLPLLKSCFIAYTSALANMICIVCLQASYIWSTWMSSVDLCRGSFAFCADWPLKQRMGKCLVCGDTHITWHKGSQLWLIFSGQLIQVNCTFCLVLQIYHARITPNRLGMNLRIWHVLNCVCTPADSSLKCVVVYLAFIFACV